jgi:flavin reductase (DIM6/NTAB) family NADH-FMN oxidoreductase RutF
MTNHLARKPAETLEPGSPPNAIDARDFRSALGSYTTGVTVVTARSPGGQYAGLTCNSFAAVSLNPALVLWSLRVHSPSMAIFQEASHFAVNVLGVAQSDLAAHFARPAPDKFANVEWNAGLGGAPILSGCVANFQCRNSNRYYGGDHVIFLGAVESYAYTSDEPLICSRSKLGTFVPLLS